MTRAGVGRGRRTLLGWAALVVVYFMWGSTFTAIQVSVRALPPLLMAGSRFLIAGLILYAVAGRTGRLSWLRPSWTELRASGVVGLLLLMGANGLVCWAELRVPSGMAAMLIATVPLWMAVIGVSSRRMPSPGPVGWAGVALGLVGVAVLAGPGSSGKLEPIYVAALLGSALLWAVGSLYSQVARLPSNFLAAAALEMVVGGIGLLLLGAATGEVGQVRWAAVGGGTVLAFSWLIVGGSLLGYTCYVYALRVLPTNTVATYAYVNPVVALALGWVILGQGMALGSLLAAALITLGVVLMVSGPVVARRRTRLRAAPEGG